MNQHYIISFSYAHVALGRYITDFYPHAITQIICSSSMVGVWCSVCECCVVVWFDLCVVLCVVRFLWYSSFLSFHSSHHSFNSIRSTRFCSQSDWCETTHIHRWVVWTTTNDTVRRHDWHIHTHGMHAMHVDTHRPSFHALTSAYTCVCVMMCVMTYFAALLEACIPTFIWIVVMDLLVIQSEASDPLSYQMQPDSGTRPK